ncbi:MAG: hypothetical protein KDA32_08595 [Phycisphaerales bacterium]|nr:hypothetical protein [Phycisphaerales bacterium]
MATPKSNEPAPLAWARRYLPHYFSEEPADFHRELLGLLEAPETRQMALVAPRGHAKSTCASLAYPLWAICERKRRNIVIITHESSLATQFVRDIRDELETNESILEEYGDLCRAPASKDGKSRIKRARWTQSKLTTATDITIQAKGSGASFRGVRVGPYRPDLVICDDLEKDDQVTTEEGRRKLEHWMRRVVMPALAPDGQIVVIGSLIHYDSLLANLRDRRRWPRWSYRVYRALEAPADVDGQHRLKALWPARWSVERLLAEKERVGTLAFEQEYQANPIDDSIRVFREEWLRPFDQRDLVEERLITLMAVDPATGTAGGDYFAIWVGSVDPTDGVIYTRQISLERIGIVEQVRRIIEAFETWRPARIGIETVAYQVALKDVLEDYSRHHGLYMPIVGLRTITNKRARIEALAPFFEKGVFRLPVGLSQEVESQFLQFPKARHDDGPDVCAMGLELARAFRAGNVTADGIARKDNPYARRGGW